MEKLQLNLTTENALISFFKATPNTPQFDTGFKESGLNFMAVIPEGGENIVKDEDYVYASFRFLSATVVGGGTWKSTDFTQPNVLAKATKKLLNKQVYKDHATYSVDNIVGVVVDVKYTEEFVSPEGEVIPAGIDGIVRIDAKANPKIARQVSSNPPEIQSCSATPVFNFTPSHEFKDRDGNFDYYEFRYKVGTEIDGKEVRRIVTDIVDFMELSLVSFGADPYSKQLDANGTPMNIDRKSIVESTKFSAEDLQGKDFEKENTYYCISELPKPAVLALGKTYLQDNDMKILELVAAKLGLNPSELTEEGISKLDFIQAEKHKQALEVAELAKTEAIRLKAVSDAEIITLKVEIESQKAIVEASKVAIEYQKKVLTEKRKQVVEAFVKATKPTDGALKGFETFIANTDEATLTELMITYNVALVETFEGACKKCGSKEITFQSSAQTEPEDLGKETKNHLFNQLNLIP